MSWRRWVQSPSRDRMLRWVCLLNFCNDVQISDVPRLNLRPPRLALEKQKQTCFHALSLPARRGARQRNYAISPWGSATSLPLVRESVCPCLTEDAFAPTSLCRLPVSVG